MRPIVVLVAFALAVALAVPAFLVAVHGITPSIGPPVLVTIDDPSLVSGDWPMYGTTCGAPTSIPPRPW